MDASNHEDFLQAPHVRLKAGEPQAFAPSFDEASTGDLNARFLSLIPPPPPPFLRGCGGSLFSLLVFVLHVTLLGSRTPVPPFFFSLQRSRLFFEASRLSLP